MKLIVFYGPGSLATIKHPLRRTLQQDVHGAAAFSRKSRFLAIKN